LKGEFERALFEQYLIDLLTNLEQDEKLGARQTVKMLTKFEEAIRRPEELERKISKNHSSARGIERLLSLLVAF
jgi:hypothetical protein